jgi:NitT/TauT family transport system substrate-binding protein
MHFLHGIDEGFWEQRDVDLDAQVTSFGRWANALTTGNQQVGTLELNSMATLVDKGEDLVHFGPNLTQINSIFVRSDSDIETAEDLRGASLGLPTWASGTATYIQAMIWDQFGFDIREETNNTTADPPSLWSLMTEQNEFDAMIQFTGFTVKGLANPDVVRPIFTAWEFWEEKTGYPALITPWTAKRSWLENNWGLALRNLEAWNDTQESFRENAESVVGQYGRLAGLTDEGDREAIIELANQGALTHDVEQFDSDLIDSQWRLLEAMADLGSIPAVPSKEEHIYSISDVRENAGM